MRSSSGQGPTLTSKRRSRIAGDWIFASRSRRGEYVGTQQYEHLFDQWVTMIGICASSHGAPSPRRTKSTMIAQHRCRAHPSVKGHGPGLHARFFSPSEAFQALSAAADVLKLFPAEVAVRKELKAIRAVLLAATRVYAVGGANTETLPTWIEHGTSGFDFGSSLCKLGQSVADTIAKAKAFVGVWRRAAGLPVRPVEA